MESDELNLYFALAEGRKADLEIVSTAAIQWVETLRAIAQAISPDADVRVELLSADESSLNFRTVVEWFERNIEPILERLERGGAKLPRTKKLLLALIPFLFITAPSTWQTYFGDNFTEADRETLKRVEADLAVKTAQKRLYRTVQRDPAIAAMGIKESKEAPPLILVPANRFAEADGLFSPDQDVPEQITHPVLEVTLVKPALVHTPRAWTFKPDGLPEFDAVMRDARVLHAIQERGFPDRLREGIRMTVRLEVREAFVDGEWKLVRGGRSVTRVISPKVD